MSDELTRPVDLALSDGALIRIQGVSYEGRPGLDVRRWFTAGSGALTATRQGVRIPAEHVEAFASAVCDCLDALAASKPAPPPEAKAKNGRRKAKSGNQPAGAKNSSREDLLTALADLAVRIESIDA